MPFKSEKQRRYLWANEPEIARDWTDTYGSRIKKNSGGVMSVQGGVDNYLGDQKTVSGVPVKWRSRPGKPETELAYITKAEKDLILKKDLHGSLKDGPNKGPGGLMSLDSAGGSYGSPGSGTGRDSPEGVGYGNGPQGPALPPGVQAAVDKGLPTSVVTKEDEKKAAKEQKIRQKKFKRQAKEKRKAEKKSLKSQIQQYLYRPNKARVKGYHQDYKNYLSELGVTNIPSTLDEEDPFGFWESDAFNYKPEVYDEFSTEEYADPNVLNYGDWMATYKGAPNVKHSGNVGKLEKYVETYETNPDGSFKLSASGNKIPATYGYKERPGEGGIDPHVFRNIGLPQGGGGGTSVTEVVEDTPSAFQESLTTGATSPFDYYVGEDPTAANLAWGEKFGVDPRTMYRTSWAADGGRIPAAYGGIMDSSTGRRGYFLGSIGKMFGKVAKAAKKVFKSPIGKAALLGGLGMYAGGLGPWASGGMWHGKAGSGFLKGMMSEGLKNKLFMKNVGTWAKPEYGAGLSLGKLGILGASALPFFMGGGDDDEDESFDYDAAKNAYAQELMRIKSGAMAGSLDPNKFVYQGIKEGGRAGYYAGGQSTPSDYTMEDAMMTTTQDKLGGITDVMKQADLYRQGSVGQFYAADGGRIGADEGGLMDLGGMEKDYRNDGGFVPLGGEEKADDVPARLSKNEFVFTADAVRGAGGGDIDKGAEIMENIMKNLEQGGQISEETQGLAGAQEMFGVSERLSEVV